jgi:hypothetical protein
MKDRFQNVSIPSNIQNFRNRPLELGNGYVINVSGYRDEYTISIFNKHITSPKANILKGTVLDYRVVKRQVSEDESMQFEHEIIIRNSIANLRFIKHYVANSSFIKHYEESGYDELVDTDIEMHKEDDICDVGGQKVEDHRELEIEKQFIDYLDILINDFKDIDYDNLRGKYCSIQRAATIRFYECIIEQLIKLMTSLKVKTLTDIVGTPELHEFNITDNINFELDDRLPKLLIPDNFLNFLGKTLKLGNGYEIGFFGIPHDLVIAIYNKEITSPLSDIKNKKGIILTYRLVRVRPFGDESVNVRHDFNIYNPLANLVFIKNIEDFYDTNYDKVKATDLEVDEDDDETIDTDVEVAENTESDPSDNNKTLNFTLPGPNGSKMSINLTINISFD